MQVSEIHRSAGEAPGRHQFATPPTLSASVDPSGKASLRMRGVARTRPQEWWQRRGSAIAGRRKQQGAHRHGKAQVFRHVRQCNAFLTQKALRFGVIRLTGPIRMGDVMLVLRVSPATSSGCALRDLHSKMANTVSIAGSGANTAHSGAPLSTEPLVWASRCLACPQCGGNNLRESGRDSP